MKALVLTLGLVNADRRDSLFAEWSLHAIGQNWLVINWVLWL